MMRTKTFAALFTAIGACVQSNPGGLVQALLSAGAKDLYSAAVRHKCASVLLHGLARMRIHDSRLVELTRLLARYAAACATSAQSTRVQLEHVLSALNECGVPYVLLKSSARLLCGDTVTEWTHAFDIDVLVPNERSDDAAAALIARRYRYGCDDAMVEGYRRYHHHLAPLLPDGSGKPVELHVALMPRTMFSLRTDWQTLRPHMQPLENVPGALVLDAFGRTLHMAVHGAGLYRLGDAVHMAAELRARPALYDDIAACVAQEQIQRIPLQAVLLAAALLAGLPVQAPRAVQRHLEWSVAREDLPKFCTGRMQLVDAWFAAGGALNAAAMQLAFPPGHRYDGTPTGLLERSRTLAGRIAAAAGFILATRRTLPEGR